MSSAENDITGTALTTKEHRGLLFLQVLPPCPFAVLSYFLGLLAGGMMPFMRRYSTIWP
jgi:hypothetical protein